MHGSRTLLRMKAVPTGDNDTSSYQASALMNLSHLQSMDKWSLNLLGGNSLSSKDLHHTLSKILSHSEVPLTSSAMSLVCVCSRMLRIFPFFTLFQCIQQIFWVFLTQHHQPCLPKALKQSLHESACFYFLFS